MRHLLTLALLTALAITGCSPVLLSEPIGKPVKIEADNLDDVVGTWKAGDETYKVTHLGGSRFQINKAKNNERKSPDDEVVVVITQIGEERFYANFEKKDDDTGKTGFMLMRMGISGDERVVLMMADPKPFAKAVDAGKLRGKVNRDQNDGDVETVQLTSSRGEVEKWLASIDGEPFNLSMVIVARKVDGKGGNKGSSSGADPGEDSAADSTEPSEGTSDAPRER